MDNNINNNMNDNNTNNNIINKNVLKIKKSNNEKFAQLYARLKGKKVLIIDLETTGFIKDKKKNTEYANDDLYDTCRIIEIGYYYSNSFGDDKDHIIYNFLRKPHEFDKQFDISKEAYDVHGITLEKCMLNGYTLIDILKYNLYTYLNTVDYIIAHNISFDLYVILNELNRLKQSATVNRLLFMNTRRRAFCTCFMTGFTKLTKLYKEEFLKEPNIAHRAGDDVKTLLELILCKQIDDITIIHTIS